LHEEVSDERILPRQYVFALAGASHWGAAFLSGCSGAQAAPESTFVLLDGSRQTTADLKGQVTLVNSGPTVV
jgi:hypothetical protein